MTRQDGNPEDVLMQWQMHLILIDSNSAKCKAKYIANSKSIDLASVSTSDQDRPGSRYFSIATGKD